MVRRGLALILILNLLALVPLPLSACAVASGLDGQCQCSMPSRCNPMASKSQSAKNGPAVSCRCIQAEAPFPNAVQSAGHPIPALLAGNFVAPAVANPPVSRAALSETLAVLHLGPPGGRAALCVFLI
jgi:hypothetical protein